VRLSLFWDKRLPPFKLVQVHLPHSLDLAVIDCNVWSRGIETQPRQLCVCRGMSWVAHCLMLWFCVWMYSGCDSTVKVIDSHLVCLDLLPAAETYMSRCRIRKGSWPELLHFFRKRLALLWSGKVCEVERPLGCIQLFSIATVRCSVL